MNTTLIWLDAAEAEFLRSYLAARAAGHATLFTRVAAQIERRLETDPSGAGESRAGHQRIMFESPLTLEYEVHAEQRVVIITRVRYTPPR